MLPLRDVIPSRTTPFITITIIALNVLGFLYELTLNDRQLHVFLYQYGVVPADFALPTLLTSMFLHGGWSHIFGNMLYLWIFGDNVEDRLGHVRFLGFYLLCGIVAAVGQMWMTPDSALPTIGASGAIAGVMGAYLVLYPRSRVLTVVTLLFFWEIVEIPAVFLLGFWFVMQLFNAGAIAVTAAGQQGGVAFMAHVAGFLMGVVGVLALRKPERVDPRWI